MKRLLFTATAVAALSVSQIAAAQAPVPLGNNPTGSGLYVDLLLGANIADDIDFDFDNDIFDDFSVEPDTGFLGSVAVGYNIPQGDLNIRIEGEFAGRANVVDEIKFEVNGDEAIENGDVRSFAFMGNAYIDYYFIPNVALTVGAGVGYANVTPDVVVITDNDDTSGFAYQGRLGARYNFSPNVAINLGYTYFATSELEIDSAAGNEINFDYVNHGLHAGFAYHF